MTGRPPSGYSDVVVRVLFVCMGNICRSPLAQGVFEDVLRREGLEDEVFVDSAGTGSWHVGSPPDERAQRSASLRGIDLSSQRAVALRRTIARASTIS